MADSARVLIVEDEADLQMILRDNLECEGYEVLATDSGERALELAIDHPPDLIVLDILLPKMSGYEVCRRLRLGGLQVPIVMVSARNTDIDRVAGLELGADDYLGKPFCVRELVARMRVQLRRQKAGGSARSEVVFGDLTVSLSRCEVRRGSSRLDLSTREFELLRYFILHQGEALTREQLLTAVWGYSSRSLTRTVDNFVAKLRKKIEANPAEPRHVVTVHGLGYRFVG